MSSGTSTPARGATPPVINSNNATTAANTGGPTPLMIGSKFVKQYYKTLSTTPDQLVKFYQPASLLSHGIGSEPVTDFTRFGSIINSADNDAMAVLAARFADEDAVGQRFEFEHGAIDAQPINNSLLLLVVTGQVVYTYADDDTTRTQPFVHSFVLGSTTTTGVSGTAGGAAGKKSYYIQNDVLRFLYVPESRSSSMPGTAAKTTTLEEVQPLLPENSVDSSAATAPLADSIAEATKEIAEEDAAAAAPTVVTANVANEKKTNATVVATESADESGGGVEESKDAVLDDIPSTIDATPPAPPSSTVSAVTQPPTSSLSTNQHSPTTATTPNSKSKTPGSWASLVAGNSGGSTSNASTPASTPARLSKTAPTAAAGGLARPSPATPVNSAATSSTAASSSSKPAPAAAATAGATDGTTTASSTNAATTMNAKPTGGAPSTGTVPRSAGSTVATAAAAAKPYSRRDPDMTLVIKNISIHTTEAEILGLLEQYRGSAAIVGTTVSAQRGIAFVDYDSPAPVVAAVAAHEAAPVVLHGRTLDIYQKTAEHNRGHHHNRGMGRGGGGGGGGGGGARNGGAYRGGGGGGGSSASFRGGGRIDGRGRGDRGGSGAVGRGGRGGRP